MTRTVGIVIGMLVFVLGACGGGSGGSAGAMSGEIKEAKRHLYEIASLYNAYTIEHTARLPRSMDELASFAESRGESDPRALESPFASDDGPKGYALLEREEVDISKVWDDTVVAWDAAAEHAGYPGVVVLFASGAAMVVDLEELRRVLREHGVAVSDARLDVPGLEGEAGAQKMYPLR